MVPPHGVTAVPDDRSTAAPRRERVFSGVQPSGLPHVGNYLGAFGNYIAMQDGYDAIYCIVDYHALTSTHDPEVIRSSTYEMALGLLALGLDPERAVLFRQSDRPEHVELMWLFASVTPTPWVERTPSFKEKKRSQPDDVNFALLSYPVLQAADIAIYKARYVPVGKDQAAHLELAREIVRAFNARYGVIFPEPEAVFSDSPVVKGTDGVNKMSKSLGNYIAVTDPADDMFGKLMSISDELMWRYFDLLSFRSNADLVRLRDAVNAGRNPMTAKLELAKEITGRFHSSAAAEQAEETFRNRSQKREVPNDVATRVEAIDEASISLARLLKQAGLVESTSAAHRLIEQGGVRIDGEKADNPKAVLSPGPPRLFQVGKRAFLRIEVVQKKS
jgi:tyrosyl-tRNA synthetase